MSEEMKTNLTMSSSDQSEMTATAQGEGLWHKPEVKDLDIKETYGGPSM